MFRAALLMAASLGVGAAASASGMQAHAGAPAPAPAAVSVPIPVSGNDRVYTADQTSNTVTVIDPSTNTALGTIALGDQRLGGTLSPQYLGDVGVHGLAVSPDHHRLAVVSVTTDTVDIVDTATNKVVSRTDVGRASHEGSFTADGRQFWVADRGRDTVTVVDAVHGGVITNLPVGQGPSKVVMSPDGKWAYVNHISLPEVTVVNVASRKVVDRITGLGDAFSSDEAISPDGRELWAAHKRAGKVSVIDLVHRRVTGVIATGPDTNHPQFVDNATGSYAYLTVGGLDQTWVYRRTGGVPALVTKIDNHGHAPHGMWPSGDGTRLYVGLEKSDAVDVIDTAANTVTDTIKIGQEPQAVVYVPRAAPAGDASNLGRQGLNQGAGDIATVLPDGTAGDALDPVRGRTLEATVRPVNGLSMIQLQARNLQPGTTYQAYSDEAGGRQDAIVSFTTDANGNAPMVLAFSAFDGRSISIAVKGAAPARGAAAPLDGMHAGNAVSAADLVYCDCC
ncbi:beta-propeller fold lactonase family protein [Kitasatospora sp. NPDC127059]|uniref:beta-propeller fold lactonase family protein n=1 Tax=unclassified Kitasatospora TaxID=2633591 RepID=UPI003655FF37